jgi:hypothetical protein
MTDMLCGYIDRDETIVAFLYDDLDAGRRRDFEAHVLTCALCREEVEGLRSVRTQLARWEPPAVVSLQSQSQSPASGRTSQAWWRTIPAWAQVAAALLFLGVSAGIANLDVHYDQTGLTFRTGWSTRPSGSAGLATPKLVGVPASEGGSGVASTVSAKDAPWRSDLAALEQQLKTEFHASQVSASTAPQAGRTASSADAETLRRVRALLDESEKRQQRELALRVAEVLHDVNAQRQADLIKIDRNLDGMQNKLGVEVLQQRQSLNYFMRVNQRQ